MVEEYLTHIYDENFMMPPPRRARKVHYQEVIMKKQTEDRLDDGTSEENSGTFDSF
jgi:hypothetical protein